MNDISYVIVACYPDKGMKSYGSKSLMTFNNKKLLEYQIAAIQKFHNKKSNHEILVVSDFESLKIQKIFNTLQVLETKNNNPVFVGCERALYKNVVFIDYGCIINHKTLKCLDLSDLSEIVCVQKYSHGKLDVGCINLNNNLHMFFDLPDNQFCNIFYLAENDTNKILNNPTYTKENLLYFEIINMLTNQNSKIHLKYTDNSNYIYFNNMRQKNAINKFFK